MAQFIRNDSGAVTVDWVVLTAGLVGLGLATMAVVSAGVQDTSDDIEGQLQGDGIIQTAFTTPAAEYGIEGFIAVNQANYDHWANEFAGDDPDEIRATYLASATTVQAFMDAGNTGWGPGVANSYHRMGAIAAELMAQGEPLPEGALLASAATAQLTATNPDFAAQLP